MSGKGHEGSILVLEGDRGIAEVAELGTHVGPRRGRDSPKVGVEKQGTVRHAEGRALRVMQGSIGVEEENQTEEGLRMA